MKIKSDKLKKIIQEEIQNVMAEARFDKKVQYVQKLLQKAGFGRYLGKWGADGKYGSSTREAVKQFQQSSQDKLQDTGKIDAATVASLKKVAKGLVPTEKGGPSLASFTSKFAVPTQVHKGKFVDPTVTGKGKALTPKAKKPADTIKDAGYYDKSPEAIKPYIDTLKGMIKTGELTTQQAVRRAKEYRKKGVWIVTDTGPDPSTTMIGEPTKVTRERR